MKKYRLCAFHFVTIYFLGIKQEGVLILGEIGYYIHNILTDESRVDVSI